MIICKNITEATEKAELFFNEHFGHTQGVTIENENENEISFYSNQDPAMDDTFTCIIKY